MGPVHSLGIVNNNAKLVAGTKTLHHVLPELVPPMDRVWTGKFFGLHNPDWHGGNQRNTFLWIYRTYRAIAIAIDPQRYVTGEGWRTSRTKIIDNAVIGYCKTELAQQSPEDRATNSSLISFWVPGYPPAKNEALSMLGHSHSHAMRVRLLLASARDAVQAHTTFTPVTEGPIALDLVLHPGAERTLGTPPTTSVVWPTCSKISLTAAQPSHISATWSMSASTATTVRSSRSATESNRE